MNVEASIPGYEIREGVDAVDFERTTALLATTYWSPGISRDRVERAARGSALVLSVHHRVDGQVGYARLVGDKTTFGWIADVFVQEGHRGRGIARAMVRYFLSHPEHQTLRRFILATRGAQPVYAGIGFVQLPHAERWMAFMPGEHRVDDAVAR